MNKEERGRPVRAPKETLIYSLVFDYMQTAERVFDKLQGMIHQTGWLPSRGVLELFGATGYLVFDAGPGKGEK